MSAYAQDLATTTASAAALPLPDSIAGTTATLVDVKGVSLQAQLFFVSPSQVNFLIPSGVANGDASIAIASGDGTASAGTVCIASVAPGLFLLNSAGLAAANVVTVNAAGAVTTGNDFQVVNGSIVPQAVNVGTAGQQVFPVLHGIGMAGRSSPANVSVSIGSVTLPVIYAEPEGEAAGPAERFASSVSRRKR